MLKEAGSDLSYFFAQSHSMLNYCLKMKLDLMFNMSEEII